MSGYIGAIPVPQATQTRQSFTATAGQTTFATAGYTPQFLDVFMNGVHLLDGVDFTATNGSDVSLTSGAAAGDIIEVVAYSTYQVNDQAFTGNFSVDTDTLYVDSTNNRVGVGTGSPANGKLVVENNGSNLYLKQTTGDYGYIIGQNDADGALTFSRRDGGNTERMRISSDGYVYVHTQSNLGGNVGSAKLHVLNPNTQGHGVAFKTNSTSGFAAATFARNSNNGAVCEFFYNVSSGAVGRIDVTSSATSYVTSSDYRLKEDVQPMTGASERVLALNPVNFAWKIDGSRVDGFLAHEAQAVVPEAVTGSKDAMRTQDVYDEDGNVTGTEEVPEYQGIDQSKLVPLLTAALQEALGRIETLEADVAALKGAS